MDVIIVSKTHMSNAACVGGLAANGKFLRLLDQNGYNQQTDTDFKVRQVWSIEYQERPNPKSPHVEDVLVVTKTLKGTLKNETFCLMIVYYGQIMVVDIFQLMVIFRNIPLVFGYPTVV